MALLPGTRVGPHEITAQIGVGGMGEVYRATDTSLKRQVAIKVLPASVAQDGERLARFQREAEVLASLNHQNIAAVYGLERADGSIALVMELVEGPTLQDRIAHGPLAIEDALPIAKQIAEALEAAHEQGIIHRDLKPANVKCRVDGTVKVLDFGLAKAVAPALAALSSSSSLSPTITTPAMTQAGVILGTAAYMSPEQARGAAVDKRTDIWAFGCLLYEMLTGRRAFEGDAVSETIASVLKSEPALDALPSSTPDALRELVRRCLVKDPRQRIRDIGDVRLALDDVLDAPTAEAHAAAARPRWRRIVPWIGAIAIGAVFAGAYIWTMSRPGPASVQRFNLTTQTAAPLLVSTSYTDLAISPDGRVIVFSAAGATRTLRRLSLLDGQETTLVNGGEPFEPFFSPDGAWVGFYDLPSQEIRRVSITGGSVQTIGRAGAQIRGATWGRDGTIVFSYANTTGLWRLPSSGGTSEQVTTPPAGEAHRYPAFLPDGSGVLFTIVREGGTTQIALLAPESRTWDVLLTSGTAPRYVSSGHLVYTASNALHAVPFDMARRRITGESTRVEPEVAVKSTGAADYDVSANGSFVFIPARALSQGSVLGWVTREGQMTDRVIDERNSHVFFPRLSPSGTRVAYQRAPVDGDIWIRDLDRSTDVRLTVEGIANLYPAWGPDPETVTFSTNRTGTFHLHVRKADLSRPAELLDEARATRLAGNWSRNGKLVFYELSDQGTSRDIWTKPLGGESTPVLVTPFNERSPQLSPDGRWLAYVSNQSGSDQVYVTPFPGGGRVIPVSPPGAREAVWSPRGNELFYRRGDQMWVVPIEDTLTLATGKPRLLFEQRYDVDPNLVGHPNYDISQDGTRFLMVRSDEGDVVSLTLVQNWLQELRRLAPTN